MEITIFVLAFIGFSSIYRVDSASPDKDCRQKDYGKFLADKDDACYYYMCTALRRWEKRRCVQSSGAVPKWYRRKYSKKPTRLNLCRVYNKKCILTASERKKQTTLIPPTPHTLPCIQNMKFDCNRRTRKCCKVGEDGNEVELQCKTNGRCEEPCFCGEFVPPADHNIEREPATGNNACGDTIQLKCQEGLVRCKGDTGKTNVQCKRNEATGVAVFEPSNDELLRCCPPCECPFREGPGNGTRSAPKDADSGNDANEKCGTVKYSCDNGFEFCDEDADTQSECTETGWDSPVPQCCPSCSGLLQACGLGAGDTECCDKENLQCSRENQCCRVRDGDCTNNGDCCRGLVCNIKTNTCDSTTIECDVALDIMFSVDTSCSIDPGDKNRIRTFMTAFAQALDLSTDMNTGVQMGAVTFNEGAQHVAYLKDSPKPNDVEFIRTIENMNLTEVGCKTHTFTALGDVNTKYFQARNGDRPGTIDICILLSDGVTVPTRNRFDTWARAKELRARGVIVLVVGLPQGCGKGKEGCKQQNHPNAKQEWGNIVGYLDGEIKKGEDPPIADFEKLQNIFSANFNNLNTVIESIGENVCGDGSVTIVEGIPE